MVESACAEKRVRKALRGGEAWAWFGKWITVLHLEEI